MLDLVIARAAVVDGSGAGIFPGSIGIRGDRIAWIGRGHPQEPESARRIDAGGHALAPGFVDVHTHSDVAPLIEPWMDSALRMGSTTVVVGNCGASPWPSAGAPEMAALTGVSPEDLDMSWSTFGGFLERLHTCRPAVNVAALVGHGALRQEAMGLERRAPTRQELAQMKRQTAEAMETGALGLSTGLIYVPGVYSRTEEVVALAEVLAPLGGLYASHIRGEGRDLFTAVREAIEIGRRADVPAHVSHLKCESDLVWGRSQELLALLEGSDATADQYPYAAWASGLSSLLPAWAPVADLAALLGDVTIRRRLVRAVEHGEPGFQSSIEGVGWDRIVVESTDDDRWNGRDLAAIAATMETDPVEAMFRLLLEEPDTAAIGHAMHEDDVRAILARPEVMVASDASAMSPTGPLGGVPVHPRTYGTFPRVLGRYVRDEGALTLEAAVRKMTSLPAERFGLTGRGTIAEGAYADLVLFDPATIADRATFESPHAYPVGIDAVVVNGRLAWDGENRERAGRVIRRGDA
ncbi:MAG: D-aminoacylase [Actinobacteria bacterium]|nr:D-aminoacylase [Actinomycetota bacterium]